MINSDTNDKIVLVDLDPLIWGTSYAVEPGESRKLNIISTKKIVNTILKDYKYVELLSVINPFLQAHLTPDNFMEDGRIHGFLAGTGNFRNSIKDFNYKQRRKERVAPKYFDLARKAVISHWRGQAKFTNGLEADDLISIVARLHGDKYGFDNVLIIHIDKDLNCIPGWHAWPNSRNLKLNRELFFVENYDLSTQTNLGSVALERTDTGRLKLYTTGFYSIAAQYFMGDPVDDIPPIKPRFGPKKVYELLTHASFESLIEMIDTTSDRYKAIYLLQTRYEAYELGTIITEDYQVFPRPIRT